MPSFLKTRAAAAAKLARPELSGLVPYRGGKSLDEMERETGRRDFIKLASNENQLGPSRKAMAAMKEAIREAHLYPEMGYPQLREAIAKRQGISAQQVILGDGSNEVLVLAASAFLRRGDEAVMASPSFAVFKHVVVAAGAKAKEVPLRNYRHDLAAMARAAGPRTRMVFVCNPNNPTGTIVTKAEMDLFFRRLPGKLICVLDEAYAEFVTDRRFPDSLAYIRRDLPVLAVRTFAKLHGLAGLRIGFGMGPKELIALLERLRQPFNVNSIAYRAAVAALRDRAHARRTIELIRRERIWLASKLAVLGYECIPSQANFILVRTDLSGSETAKRLIPHGVLVRALPGPGIQDCIRITVGTRPQNLKVVQAMRDLKKGETRR